MKSFVKLILMAAIAAASISCGAPANNPNSTTSATAPKPPAAPTADDLLNLEKKANEAYIKGDSQYFQTLLSDKVVMTDGSHRMDKAEILKLISGVKCDLKEGWSMTEPHMEKINDDTYVLIYKATMDGTCTYNGKTEKQPSPLRAVTVWLRNGDHWQAAFHGENLIVDPKTLSQTLKKEGAQKATTKKGSAAPASPNPTPDPTTDALMSAEKAVWDAWKNKDGKTIDQLTTPDLSFVNIFGTYFTNKADAIKDWTGSTCNVKSVSLTNGVGTLISPTVGFLTVTGLADGECGGVKPPPSTPTASTLRTAKPGSGPSASTRHADSCSRGRSSRAVLRHLYKRCLLIAVLSRNLAPRGRFELPTFRLTAERSTVELPGNRQQSNLQQMGVVLQAAIGRLYWCCCFQNLPTHPFRLSQGLSCSRAASGCWESCDGSRILHLTSLLCNLLNLF